MVPSITAGFIETLGARRLCKREGQLPQMWPEGPQQHTLVGAGVRIMSRAQPFLGALAAHAPPNASNTQTRPGLAGVCAWLAALSPEAPACLRAGRRKASFFSNLRVFIVCCCGWFVERHTIQSSSKTHPHPLQESALEGPRKLCRGQEVQPCLLGTTGCRDRRCLSLSVCLSGAARSLAFSAFLPLCLTDHLSLLLSMELLRPNPRGKLSESLSLL